MNQRQFHFRITCISATIGPRSGHDRGPGRSLIAVRSNCGDSTTLALRSRLDRATIAVQSNRDRGVLPLALWAVRLNFRWLDGHDRAITWTKIARSVRRPMEEARNDDRDRDAVRSMRIPRSRHRPRVAR